MLSLATHEPYFKVLREDVFAQAPGGRGCHKCGREGHIAANCIGDAAPPPPKDDMIVKKPQQPEVKPFIFLDVCILREYLEVELALPNLSFPFDLERAIDDWIFLIFFVGNDFLPHLPSLEIREGAIDELLRIWKRELPLLGGYLTSHGKVDLKNIQRVMEGIASLEDDIFRKRRDAEERQDATQKRRRIEDHTRQRAQHASERRARGEPEPDSDTMSHGGTDYVAVSVDARAQDEARKRALAALESGDKGQVIDNQRAIRMANLSAAERLKAEMAGAKAQAARPSGPVKQEAGSSTNGDAAAGVPAEEEGKPKPDAAESSATAATDDAAIFKMDEETADATADGEAAPVRSRKRAHDAVAGAITDDGDEKSTDEDNDGDAKDDTEAVDPIVATNFERKVNADGTVEYEDTVKLWEPGYRERYYRQKFGVGLDDADFRRAVVKSYVEGLAWVLAYYYQGCPSWTWYYPYHFSPFAADFVELETLDITFDVGQPFRPYDQLMGVLPADS
jgi:5'-3' exoribonuclease 2